MFGYKSKQTPRGFRQWTVNYPIYLASLAGKAPGCEDYLIGTPQVPLLLLAHLQPPQPTQSVSLVN